MAFIVNTDLRAAAAEALETSIETIAAETEGGLFLDIQSSTGTVLVSIALPNDMFDVVVDTLTLKGTWSAQAIATGDAHLFYVWNHVDEPPTPYFIGSVGHTGGSEALILTSASNTITIGQTITIATFNITVG